MKIKKIAIEGFKGIEKMEYIPNSKIGTLIASNGSGKTSFFQAMESLFGNTNKDKVFIREGCPIATISVTTEGILMNVFCLVRSRINFELITNTLRKQNFTML